MSLPLPISSPIPNIFACTAKYKWCAVSNIYKSQDDDLWLLPIFGVSGTTGNSPKFAPDRPWVSCISWEMPGKLACKGKVFPFHALPQLSDDYD